MNCDEYMRALVGEMPKNYINSDINNVNTYWEDINILEPTVNKIDLYPDIFIQINPMSVNRCKNINQKITREIVKQITDEMYDKILKNLDDNISDRNRTPVPTSKPRPNNDFLRDLIQLLVINQLLRNREIESRKYLQF